MKPLISTSKEIKWQNQKTVHFSCWGGAYKTPVYQEDEGSFAADDLVFKPLARHLKIEHKKSRGCFRDADFASRCSDLQDEDNVNFLYREKNGMKKIFCIVSSMVTEWDIAFR